MPWPTRWLCARLLPMLLHFLFPPSPVPPVKRQPPSRARLASVAVGEDYGELLAQVRQELDDVEVALRRLDEGAYGRCELCGQAIADEELAALPVARRCGLCR